jgi:hypothetical protein
MSKYRFSFSWKRALGITSAKQKFASQIGIPTTQSGLERKVGRSIIYSQFSSDDPSFYL